MVALHVALFRSRKSKAEALVLRNILNDRKPSDIEEGASKILVRES